MKASEVLLAAADDLEVNGWTIGIDGMKVEGPHCALGAISAALDSALAYKDGYYSYENVYHPAGEAFARYLVPLPADRAILGKDIFFWNDEQKSAAPVIEALRACAVIEAARESETALAVT